MRRGPLFAILGATLAAAACGTPDPVVSYDPYVGAAFPARRPDLPAPKGTFAYVSNNGSDAITVLDLPSNEVAATVPVGRDPVALDGPHHLAVDAAGTVYVALQYPEPTSLPGPHAAHASSTRPGWVQMLAPSDLHLLGQVQVQANPGEIVLSPDGLTLVVTHFDLAAAVQGTTPEAQKSSVAIIDTRTFGSPDGPRVRFVKACRATHGASISADSRTAYVACYADDALAIIDLTSPEPAVSMVSMGLRGPYSAVASPSGRWLAVGATDGRETRLFDTSARAPGKVSIVTPGASYFAAWSEDDKTLWIPTQGPDAIVVANAETGDVLRQRRFEPGVCDKPHEADLGPGPTLYVVCEGDHVRPSAVLALDPSTLETRATIPVGIYPDRMALRRAR